ncbi:MAG: GAF domain-containing protein [bacterium]|nr:GAF domain-containing protein [bacterium]
MGSFNNKIEIIQNWLMVISQSHTSNSTTFAMVESLLDDIVTLIQHDISAATFEQNLSATYDDFEKQVAQQTATLNQATEDLKSQITQRKLSALKLQKAYSTLEMRLKEHIKSHSKLNQQLQEQIIEYKRMQVLEHEEHTFTEALRKTLTTMSSTLDLDKILDHILNTVGQVTAYDGANVLLVESNVVRVVRQTGYKDQRLEKNWLNEHIPGMKLAILQQLMDMGKPVAIANISTSPLWIGFPGLEWVHSNVIAPIRANGKILGFLSLDSATPEFFTEIHAERLQTFADQAAIAIQNAGLLDRAKRSAVLAERNRLASELHDTISQALWSMSLIAERLPTIWEINKDEGRHSLSIMNELAKNALEEMRLLLLELRPASLTHAKLGDLIRQVATIITNRTGLKITVHTNKQDPLPEDVHFALYRVAQEALNNITLHASASHVEVIFNSELGQVDLSIQDNGIGFNPEEIATGHFGLSIMGDRIKTIGGTLNIISRRGEGTLIKVVWASADSTILETASNEI